MKRAKILLVMFRFLIPQNELKYTFCRSSGKGGQNINKVETRVTALWNFLASHQLTTEQKQLLLKKLSRHLNSFNQLAITNQDSRSQNQNRLLAINRLNFLVRKALTKPRLRRPTLIPKKSKLKRLEQKKIRSQKISLRRTPLDKL